LKFGFLADFIENDHVKIWIEEDIVNVLYKNKSIIGLKTAKELVAKRLELQKGRIYKAIAFIQEVGTASSEARKYLATEEAYEGVEKVALISNSSISTFLGNIFITNQQTS
jgi:hypothetical protein